MLIMVTVTAQTVRTALVRALSEDQVFDDQAERICYSYDATRLEALPDVVVFPQTPEQVQQVVAIAIDTGTPLVPRGAGTGFVGGAVPVKGGIVLSLERMNRIIEIDPHNLVAVVEPGVVTGDLHKAVEAMGLFYPPDPSSAATCTIGGNAACGATGPRSVKYGGTRDYVLGLDAVLPTGEMVHTPSKAVKRVVGIDLARLLVGTEGTLGIITGLTLRLLPKPATVRTMLASFTRVTDAARAVSGTIAAGWLPRACEFMDHRCLELIRAHGAVTIPDAAGALLILETDGTAEESARVAAAISEVCREVGALEVRTAESTEEAAAIWAARKALSQAMYEVAPGKINEDIVVPRSALPELVAQVDELAMQSGLAIVCFGHAGEGNLHVNIMADLADPSIRQTAEVVVQSLFDTVVRLKGSVSGEHGIGLTKARYLPTEVSAEGLQVMARVKAAMDPHGIMNPGKILL